MTLAPGARLGPYEVTGPLGAGGMGEVYRALDSAPGRQVALKVLPEALAHEPERLARFEREARALASLNHPDIAQIVVGGVDNAQNRQYDVSSDGRFLINSVLDDVSPITLIQNRRAPAP